MGLGVMFRRSAVGLTIGQEFVTMVRLSMKRSRATLEKAVTCPIPEPRGETDIVEVLRELIADEKIRCHELAISVPRNEITTRIIALPSSDVREIHQMVQLEVEELVPYSANELEVDEAVLEQLPDGSSKVLVAIVHKDVVERQTALLGGAEIEPARVGVSCFALYNAFMFGGGASSESPVALLDVSDLGTDILIASEGRVLFTRGVAHLRAPSATADQIAAELRSSLEAYSRETGAATVERALLSGHIGKSDEVARRLTDALGVRVEEADFVAQACDVEGTGSRYAVQVGLALSVLRKPALDLNLMPRQLREQKRGKERRKAQLTIVALGALVLLLAYLVLNSRMADKRRFIKFLDERIAQMEAPANVVKERKTRVEAIRAQLSKKNSALEVLGKIHELVPEGLVLEEVTFVRDKNILISGKCYDRPLAFEFARRLRDSGVEALSKSEVSDTRDETVEGVPVIRFDVRTPIAVPEAAGSQQQEQLPATSSEEEE